MEFYSSIAELYDFIFPLSEDQVDFVESEVHAGLRQSPERKLRILDVGCGTGNLSLALAERGCRPTGIDFDGEMIGRAEEKAGGDEKTGRESLPGSPVNFMQMDMLNIDKEFPPGSFDAVLCFGNTLVHLTEPEKIRRFIRAASRILVQGGLLLLQIINYDRILNRNISGLPTIENEYLKFERNYSIEPDTGLVLFHTVLLEKKTGEMIVNTIPLYPLREQQLRRFLEDAGFESIKLFGSFSGSSFSPESVPLIASSRIE